ncbi:hypothetical protein ACFO0N_16255 [Halobium salinum]|uniref:DUF2062 domain-containing protein n=1 Tax=Halobium salinum TaxID=1364940 RepID=A0ABD5PGB1_9EURY|nr:hypothetical protein [Halobium salinum]
MVPSARSRSTARAVLLGPVEDRFGRRLDALLAAAVGVLTFVAYVAGAFAVSGGVVFLPWHATLVGFVTAGLVGYRGGGLTFGWLAVLAPLYGFHADWALFGLSSRSLAGQVEYLFQPTAFVVFSLAALVVGTVGFAAGVALWRGLGAVRGRFGAQSS